MAPSVLMEWDPRDRALAVGLLALEEQTSTFGHDLTSVTDPRAEGEYEVRTLTDLEQAALDVWRDAHPKPGPGVRPYVVHVGSGAESKMDGGSQGGTAEAGLPAVGNLD